MILSDGKVMMVWISSDVLDLYIYIGVFVLGLNLVLIIGWLGGGDLILLWCFVDNFSWGVFNYIFLSLDCCF